MYSNNWRITKQSGNNSGSMSDRFSTWYQSPRLGRSLGGVDDFKTEGNIDAFSKAWDEYETSKNSSIEGNRDRDVRDSDQFKRRLWYQRRKEVLKRLDRLNFCETDFSISKPQPSLFSNRKMK